jgi:hypothetical protein
MNDSIGTGIVDLSDEMLLIILNKLEYIDVLYSLRGVNKKFDKLTRDPSLSRSLNFAIVSSNEENNLMLIYYLKLNKISNVLLSNHH